MDPAGIREVYLLRPYTRNPYQFEHIALGLPFKTRVHPVYAINPWFPFSEPLTQRVSRQSEGYAGWLQYDCAVLAGVDLESSTERDVWNIRSALERGLPVCLCGGCFGLGHSYRLWHELETALPARIPAGEAADCSSEATACADHPVLRGLPNAFGQVASLHPLEVHDDSTVLIEADGRPVLVASEKNGSRQLILAVADADGMCCDPLWQGGFYDHPFYPDLIRNCLQWLMGVELPLWLDSLHLDTGLYSEDDEHAFSVRVLRPEAAPGAVLRCYVYSLDEGRLASGGDAGRDERLAEETRTIDSAQQDEAFAVQDARAGRCSGVYEVELSLEMDDPPRTNPTDCFAMGGPPGWNNWKGRAVDVRRFRLRFADRRRTRVSIPGRTVTIEERKPWRIRAESRVAVSCSLRVQDASGTSVGGVKCEADKQHDLVWTPPPLMHGDYTAVLNVEGQNDLREQFRFALKSVTVPPADDSFRMVSHAGTGTLNDDEMEQLMRANLDEFGLDTISRGILSHTELIGDASVDWSKQPFQVRRARWLDALVAAEGRHLWGDFDARLVLLESHGTGKSYAPTEPCVHHPDYEDTVRSYLAPKFRLMDARAGLISTEIIDEPHLYPSNVCRCDICLKLYRERYSEELPQWAELEGDRTLRRWHFFEWLEDYSTRAFAATMRIKEEVAPEVRVHNVAIDRHTSSNFMFNGIHRWARHGDELHMACYPWSYLSWRGLEQMPHAQTHWIAAWIRGLATHHGIPWGVFMELWEHDIPNRQMPAYWSVGQFYSLLAEGVDRMDTFFVSFGSEVFGMSFERLKEFGREVNKVRPFFPLLARTKRTRARMAFVEPWAEWVMNPREHYLPPDHEGYGYYRRYAIPFDRLYPNENRRMLAYELLHRVFNDLDLVDEQLLCESPLNYDAVVVCDCTYLKQDTMVQLRDFVEGGGVLILDRIPERDEHGNESDTLKSLITDERQPPAIIIPGLSYRSYTAGSGRLILFSASLQTTYAGVVESEKAGHLARVETALADLLLACGLRSRCTSSNGYIDAHIRRGDGFCLVPVANTASSPQSASVTLRDLDFTPTFAANLTDGSFIDISATQGEATLETALEAYHGGLYALYASRPACLACSVPEGSIEVGAELEYTVTLQEDLERRARVVFVVAVRVSDPNGTVHRGLGGDLAVSAGTTVRRRLPVNAIAGAWQIRVEDPIIGLTAEADFTVTAAGVDLRIRPPTRPAAPSALS